MPDRKPSSTPTRLDKPLLKLAKPAGKSAGKSFGKSAGKPAGKFAGKSAGKPAGKSAGKPAQKYDKKPVTQPGPKAASIVDDIYSRRIAYNILLAVDEGAQLDKALAADPDLPKLEDRDRRFVRLLVTCALRQRGQLEMVLAPLIERRPFGAQASANLILLLGAAQLLILQTGAHAAVNSTVELMRAAGFERLCGLANAVMRRLTREGEARWVTTSHMENLPDWLRRSWRHYWGDEAAEAIAGLAMKPPPLDISVKQDPEIWAKKLEATIIDGNSMRREFDGDPTLLDGFEDGAWWVQDAAAALPARLLNLQAGEAAIDLCAAPGGKTAQMIASGATVTAIDNSRKRLDRLRRNLKRLNLSANLILQDGNKFTPDAPVDAVLVDAPCSATGTVRRRPDIFNQREAEDITVLQQIQWELTTSALGWLKPGGRLVYATCSLQPEEGEDVVSAILDAAEGRVKIDPISPAEAGVFARSIIENGSLRILPSDYVDIGGVDGFFITRLISVE